MKYILTLVLACCFMSMSFAYSDHIYNWAEHTDSHDLYTSLKDEPELIFILYWFKTKDGDDKLKKQNEDLKSQIQKGVLDSHPDIVFTEIDMTSEDSQSKYDVLFNEIMQIKAEELDEAPVVAVVNNGEGAWIHGKGTMTEVSESVDIFIHEANDRKMGGTGYVYGSDKARKDGTVSIKR